MTLKYIWCWGSKAGDLGSLEYSLTAIIPRSTQTQNDSTF